MQRVRLGKTELQVSPIAFGTWSFGGEWGRFDTDEAKATVARAVELGINLFDSRGMPRSMRSWPPTSGAARALPSLGRWGDNPSFASVGCSALAGRVWRGVPH